MRSLFYPLSLCLGLVLLSGPQVLAQSLQILDEAGEPVIGATVELLDPASSVDSLAKTVLITDLDGKVILDDLATAANASIRLRYVGYVTQTVLLSKLLEEPVGSGFSLQLQPAQAVLAQAVVTSVRARPADPFAFVTLDGKNLSDANVGQDIPFLLRRTPGVVYTSDAGNGVGYTGIRVRGADATRINVTINGVPLNDSESQSVYWVNLPDMISSTSSLQIQRGVGESTYGSGAFGANINLITRAPDQTASLNGEVAGGSFGTVRTMLRANSGEFGPGISVEARLSLTRSDGYVDRASSRLGSAFLSAAWAISDQQRLQLIATHGQERTYQSWFGIPESYADDSGLRTYNPAGARASGGFYEDQVDNYGQSHLQLLYSADVGSEWLLQLTGHYTHGRGYYEEWRNGDRFGRYFPTHPAADSITDLVRQLWLVNDFGGAIATLSGRLSPKLTATFSAGYNYYFGDHFTAIPQISSPALANQTATRVYGNDATKTDANAFAKLTYRLTDEFSLYGDLQVRNVDYQLAASRKDNRDRREGLYTFVNPKMGATLLLPAWTFDDARQPASLYMSTALGQREPNRNDFIDAPLGRIPSSERLYDLELGMRSPRGQRLSFEATAYYMDYRDQLALTGRINEVGEAIRINVPRSHRLGLELSLAALLKASASATAQHRYTIDANVALSDSRVLRYEEAIDNFTSGLQEIVVRNKTPLAFSPRLISNVGLLYVRTATKGSRLEMALWGNVVSRQFLDNSGVLATSLPTYGRLDLEMSYSPAFDKNALRFTLQVQNFTAAKTVSNGYVYRYLSPGYDPRPDDPYSIREAGDTYLAKGVYPQAGIQVLAGLRYRLAKN